MKLKILLEKLQDAVVSTNTLKAESKISSETEMQRKEMEHNELTADLSRSDTIRQKNPTPFNNHKLYGIYSLRLLKQLRKEDFKKRLKNSDLYRLLKQEKQNTDKSESDSNDSQNDDSGVEAANAIKKSDTDVVKKKSDGSDATVADRLHTGSTVIVMTKRASASDSLQIPGPTESIEILGCQEKRKCCPPLTSTSSEFFLPDDDNFDDDYFDVKQEKLEMELEIAKEKLEIKLRQKYKLDLELIKLEKELKLQPSVFTAPFIGMDVRAMDTGGESDEILPPRTSSEAGS